MYTLPRVYIGHSSIRDSIIIVSRASSTWIARTDDKSRSSRVNFLKRRCWEESLGFSQGHLPSQSPFIFAIALEKVAVGDSANSMVFVKNLKLNYKLTADTDHSLLFSSLLRCVSLYAVEFLSAPICWSIPSLDRLLWNLNLLCGNGLSVSTIRSRFRDFVAVDFRHACGISPCLVIRSWSVLRLEKVREDDSCR